MGDAWNVELGRRLWEALRSTPDGQTAGLYFGTRELAHLVDAVDVFERPVVVNACQDSAALARVVAELGRKVKALEEWKGRCCSV